MAILTNYPNTFPTLSLDFANSKRLDPRITFTRATTATFYDGKTTAKAEENLLQRSQEFDNAYWNKTNLSVTANSVAAPDGTTTADTFVESIDVSAQQHYISRGSPVATVATFSVYLKANTRSNAFLYFTDGNAGRGFDLSAGTSFAVTGIATPTSYSITSVGNSWYRCVITGSNLVGNGFRIQMLNANTGTALAYIGDGSSIYVWGAQIESRSSVTAYTATTSLPITNYIPVIQTAASGIARFDHDPTTFKSLGLLIEESRTNSLLQSEDFSTTWSATRATVSTNVVISPGGTLTADRLIPSTDNDTHFVTQTLTGTAVPYTFHVYAKAGGYNFLALRLYDGTSQVGLAYFNLSTGATGTVTAGTATIAAVGNSWYWCSLTATLAASASCTADIYVASADNTNSFAGNAFDGVTVWGAQCEAGSFATSYIPTTSATVTRNADDVKMTGTNFSSWYKAQEGTLYTEITPKALAVSSGMQFNDGTINNRIRLATTSTTDQGKVTTSGTAQATLDGGTPAANTEMKLALAYKANDFALSLNGGTVATDTSGSLPNVTQLQIGAETTTIGNVTVRKVSYYPFRIIDTDLQGLTSA